MEIARIIYIKEIKLSLLNFKCYNGMNEFCISTVKSSLLTRHWLVIKKLDTWNDCTSISLKFLQCHLKLTKRGGNEVISNLNKITITIKKKYPTAFFSNMILTCNNKKKGGGGKQQTFHRKIYISHTYLCSCKIKNDTMRVAVFI